MKPESKIGKCDWCGKHLTMVWFVLGQRDGRIWCGWLCPKCMQAARELQNNDR